ncbi:helix-turn-helix domain-containing protein [Legionella jamestowniensis]|uniref:Putative Antitoxin higA-2 n=1 Tax=Legionella jamestowniensis TaxID=455 RepID=A0A0W0UNZ3_9GAMM|nr:transcriptional regulator [Legionella jamestowniensis]KTD09350.1 putative Antitoxin higA-2 [Legionella jamestowniensis]SFL87956.1 putative transcriptional regulator [Legionella jamestowniensis DSM 19215]
MKTNEESTTSKSKGKTNWDRVKKMTNEEIEKAANSDPDAPLYSKEKLRSMGFKRVNPVQEVDVKFIRGRLKMTQEEFARSFGFKKRTLEGWEQHRREPTGAAKLFLKVIEINPRAVSQALEELHGSNDTLTNQIKKIDSLQKELELNASRSESQRKD